MELLGSDVEHVCRMDGKIRPLGSITLGLFRRSL